MPNNIPQTQINPVLGKCMKLTGNENKPLQESLVSCEDMIRAQHKWTAVIESKTSRKSKPKKNKSIRAGELKTDENGNEIKSIAMSYCGKWSAEIRPDQNRNGVVVQYRENGTIQVKGTAIKCGSPNCYWCSKEVAKRESDNIAKIMRVAIMEGYEIYLATFTHKKHADSIFNCELTNKGHKALYQAIRDVNKWSQIKNLSNIEMRSITEPTFSRQLEWLDNSIMTKAIHSHIHALIFIPNNEGKLTLDIHQYLRNRWARTMEQLGSLSHIEGDSAIGVDFRRVSENARDISNCSAYISKKIMYDDNVRYEMTHTHNKRSNNRNIVELLRDIVLYEDSKDIHLYRTWIKQAQGKWNYRKTKGIDKWLIKANLIENAIRSENAEEFLKRAKLKEPLISEYQDNIEEWIEMVKYNEQPKETQVLYEMEIHPHLWNSTTIQGNHYKLLKMLRLYWKVGKYEEEYKKLVHLNKSCYNGYIEQLHKQSLWWEELKDLYKNVV